MTVRTTEKIVVVDEHDIETGEEDKEKCHDGSGLLHRGFLCMVFSSGGELLLTKRGAGKRLWPGYWDGSIASHVFKGEDYIAASRRRLREELGLAAGTVEYAFKFRYYAQYRDAGAEHEICAVTIIRGVDPEFLSPNPEEISETRMVELKELIEEVRAGTEHYTPWLVLALEHISERPLAGGAGPLHAAA